MKYQLSAGCGHGGLCGSTSAGSGFKEKTFPFFQHKKDTGLRPSLLWRSTDLTERGQGQRFGAWAGTGGGAKWASVRSAE